MGETNLDMSSSSAAANEETTKDKEEVTIAVPFFKLFVFADSIDKLLMIVGTIAGLGNGLCMPLLSVFLGEMIDSFGETQDNINHVVRVVSKVIHPQQLHIILFTKFVVNMIAFEFEPG